MSNASLSSFVDKGSSFRDTNLEPEAGKDYKVKVVKANGQVRNGAPSFGFWVEVIAGPDREGRFWLNASYSTKHDFLNARANETLKALGYSEQFLKSATIDSIVGTAEGRTTEIRAKYNKKGYFEPVFLVTPGALPGVAADALDQDDSDLD